MARLPLRVRLVAGFSATMLLVLLAAGGFVYWRVQYALDRQVNEDLTETSTRLAPLVTDIGTLRSTATPADRSEIYQVLDRRSRILSSSPTAGPQPLIAAQDAQAAVTAPVRRDIGALIPIKNQPLRAYATPLSTAGGTAAVLVVAVRRDHRDEALLELLAQLSLAGLGALVVTAAVGYLLARSALHPVERYRSQAERIIGGAPGVRLDVPDGRDDEVTRLGDTLNRMLDALDASLERERDFVRDASHELRTPITLLTTRLQLATRRSRTVAEHQDILREVQTDLDRLAALAEHLLQLESPRPGGTEAADLAVVAGTEVERRNTGTSSHNTQSEDRFRIHIETPSQVPLRPVELSQIVGNLLDNASLHGSAPVDVTVDRVDTWARLLVRDAGPGMTPELLANATRRFARAPKSRARPGFGLGLSLVADITNRASGQVRLCYDGLHERFGVPNDAPCRHDTAMTVTVLLPVVDAVSSVG